MGFTLHLEDKLAEELRQEASAEHVSVEELAHRLVRDGLQQRVAAKRWRSQNRRRLELIAKRLQAALSAEEQEEFRRLQSLADEMAAPSTWPSSRLSRACGGRWRGCQGSPPREPRRRDGVRLPEGPPGRELMP
jgi:hypothetical protein